MPANPLKKLTEILEKLGVVAKRPEVAIAYVPVRRHPIPKPTRPAPTRHTGGCA